jgi:gamma-glutamylcyclotransferase
MTTADDYLHTRFASDKTGIRRKKGGEKVDYIFTFFFFFPSCLRSEKKPSKRLFQQTKKYTLYRVHTHSRQNKKISGGNQEKPNPPSQETLKKNSPRNYRNQYTHTHTHTMGSSQESDSATSQDSYMTITPSDRREILYFAYGSNLSSSQMLKRCPNSTPVGLGYLSGWEWFVNTRGYANVRLEQVDSSGEDTERGDERGDAEEESKGKGKGKDVEETMKDADGDFESLGVYGVLYLLPPEDEKLLDRYEGVPWAYEKTILDVEIVQESQSSESNGSYQPQMVQALVYIDYKRTEDGPPKEEYIKRMNLGIEEAVEEWELPDWYIDGVMRTFIPPPEDDDDME